MVLQEAGGMSEVEARVLRHREGHTERTKYPAYCSNSAPFRHSARTRAHTHTHTHTSMCQGEGEGSEKWNMPNCGCHSTSIVPEVSKGNGLLRNLAPNLTSTSQWIKRLAYKHLTLPPMAMPETCSASMPAIPSSPPLQWKQSLYSLSV